MPASDPEHQAGRPGGAAATSDQAALNSSSTTTADADTDAEDDFVAWASRAGLQGAPESMQAHLRVSRCPWRGMIWIKWAVLRA